MAGLKGGSKVKNTPFGPDWDGSEQAPTQDAVYDLIQNLGSVSLPYAQVPKRILVSKDSALMVAAAAGVRIFHADLSAGFNVLGSISILSPGSVVIGSGSKATVLGV